MGVLQERCKMPPIYFGPTRRIQDVSSTARLLRKISPFLSTLRWLNVAKKVSIGSLKNRVSLPVAAVLLWLPRTSSLLIGKLSGASETPKELSSLPSLGMTPLIPSKNAAANWHGFQAKTVQEQATSSSQVKSIIICLLYLKNLGFSNNYAGFM